MKDWQEYYWTKHALLRIYEYGWTLRKVFDWFAESVEVDKSDYELLKEFLKHGGIKGMQAQIFAHQQINFVIQKKTVVTVIHTAKYAKLHKNSVSYQIKEINGKQRLMPVLK